MRSRLIGSNANLRFRSQTIGAAGGLVRCSRPEMECRASKPRPRRLTAEILRANEPMKALALKTSVSMADVPRDARLVRIVKELAPSQMGPPREQRPARPICLLPHNIRALAERAPAPSSATTRPQPGLADILPQARKRRILMRDSRVSAQLGQSKHRLHAQRCGYQGRPGLRPLPEHDHRRRPHSPRHRWRDLPSPSTSSDSASSIHSILPGSRGIRLTVNWAGRFFVMSRC